MAILDGDLGRVCPNLEIVEMVIDIGLCRFDKADAKRFWTEPHNKTEWAQKEMALPTLQKLECYGRWQGRKDAESVRDLVETFRDMLIERKIIPLSTQIVYLDEGWYAHSGGYYTWMDTMQI